jgi:hypothetical protein
MHGRTRWLLLGATVSGALHLALAWWMPRHTTREAPQLPRMVELSVLEQPVVGPTHQGETSAAESPPREPVKTHARRVGAAAKSQPGPPETAAVLDPARQLQIAATEPARLIAQPSAPKAPSTVLTPQAVAASWHADGRLSCRAPVAASECSSSTNPQSAPGVAGEGVDGSSRDTALRRRSDRSYEYESDAFTAIIEKDGRVRFEDRLGETTLGPTLGYDSDTKDVRIGVTVTSNFDLDDFVEKVLLERTLYPHAKARFIEQTRALRNELAARYDREGAARADMTVHREFLRVLRDDALHPREKRAVIFALWNDCAEDDAGAQAQHAIERFIREHMPQGSGLGYPAEELLAFNAQRAGARAFAPYAAN